MNPNEEAELDSILAGAEYTEADQVMEQLGSTTELIGAAKSLTDDAKNTEEMAPWEESGGEL